MSLQKLIYYRDIIDYTESMEVVFPSYQYERKTNKEAMNIVLTFAYINDNRENDDIYLILHKTIEEAGTSYRMAMDMLDKYPVFVHTGNEWSYTKGIAKEWRITQQGIDVYKNAISGVDVCYRFEGSRRRIVNLSKIPSRFKGKYIADYRHSATIDIISLEKYVQEKGMDVGSPVFKLLNIAKYKNGELDLDYLRKDKGRLFGTGLNNLQTIPKEARRAAFKGAWDYDLANAHYRIASHFTNNRFIQEYAYDSSLIRKLVAHDVDVNVKEVKSFYLMLMYGAGTTLRSDKTLVKEFGKEKAKALLNHPYSRNILKGLEDLTEDLHIEHGMEIPEGLEAKQARALFLQEHEAAILDCCIQHVKPELLLFDGFISREDVSAEWLRGIIEKDTGFDIQVTKEKIIT